MGISLKGLDGILEIIGGTLLLLVGPGTINRLVWILTRRELSEDPHDIFANWLIKTAHHFSASTQLFVSFYLLSHGIIKVFLVVCLWHHRRRAYPAAMIFFMLFILYQIYRYSYTYSGWLILLTILDALILLLTWLEYKRIREKDIQ